MPYAWAMKPVATPCMIAVPSMLMVAPSGIVKDAMELSTPSLCSTVSRVTGSVALLLAVLKASDHGIAHLAVEGSHGEPAEQSSAAADR